MANANSTATPPIDKFVETNTAICDASYVAHFLAETFTKHTATQSAIELSNCEVQGIACVLKDLVNRVEGLLSLLDECKESTNHVN